MTGTVASRNLPVPGHAVVDCTSREERESCSWSRMEAVAHLGVDRIADFDMLAHSLV